MEQGQAHKALKLYKSLATLLRQSTESSFSADQLQEVVRQSLPMIATTKKKRSVLEVRALDDDEEQAKYCAARYGPSSSVYFPLRLSDTCADEASTSNFKYMTACILYNFSLAFRAGYITKPHKKFLTAAEQSSRTAESLLISCAHQTEDLLELHRSDNLLALLRNSMEQIGREKALLKQPEDDSDEEASPSHKGNSAASTPSFVHPDEMAFVQAMYHQKTVLAAAA
jgi:hypothetical protein